MNTSIEKGRVYHPWNLWEDYKHGFYERSIPKESTKSDVIFFFNDPILTEKYMNLVINKWKYSCEHNLTNYNMNRIAWIGQAAVCLYNRTPCYNTMYAWKFIDFSIQNRSDIIAFKTIKKWEQERILNLTLRNGKIEDIKTEYQTSRQLNLNFQD